MEELPLTLRALSGLTRPVLLWPDGCGGEAGIRFNFQHHPCTCGATVNWNHLESRASLEATAVATNASTAAGAA